MALCCGCAMSLLATDASALFVVNQPWVRPARSGQATEVYMSLTSTDGATLVAAHTTAAATIALRGPGESARRIAELALPAGAPVELAPGSYRLVLGKLARPVKLGDHIPLALTIEAADGTRQDIVVEAVARRRSAVDDERLAHRHQHSH